LYNQNSTSFLQNRLRSIPKPIALFFKKPFGSIAVSHSKIPKTIGPVLIDSFLQRFFVKGVMVGSMKG